MYTKNTISVSKTCIILIKDFFSACVYVVLSSFMCKNFLMSQIAERLEMQDTTNIQYSKKLCKKSKIHI